MNNYQESHQPNNRSDPSNITHQRNLDFIQAKQDIFSFLRKEERPDLNSSPSFFSENGLCQDIIQVTQAEPDICLEVFYALYNALWPQIEKQSDISIKDAWTRFIGVSVMKGILCPPEKLITERRLRDLKRILTQHEGEDQIFQKLDHVVRSISHLKEKIENYQGEILQKEEIMASLSLVQEFYQSYPNKVKDLVQAIIEKEQNNVSHTSEFEALEDLLEPKAIMMGDIFAHHWAYRISRNKAQKLLSLDVSGGSLKSNLNDAANHRVIALPENTDKPLVFFKANGNPPIQPEKEFMLYSLYQNLEIPVPETALLILTDVFETNPEYFYAIQASEAVNGESPLKAYRNPETIFDHEAYVFQTIGAFLTNPSDGSFKNFKYSPKYQTLISIDNDLVFKEELIGKDDRKVINVKSILFLLSQIDLPIPESIKTFFTSLDPHLTALAWLKDLSQKNIEYNLLYTRLAFQKTRCIYQNLLPQSQVPPLAECFQNKIQVDPELHSDSFCPQILLSKDLLIQLIEKLQVIEKALLINRSATTQTLFEEVSLVLGIYYRKLRLKFSDPEEALEASWGEKKDGVDYSYISSLLDREELNNFPTSKNNSSENLIPEKFLKENMDLLLSQESAIDRFIKRQNQRKRNKILNLPAALKELRLLIQEGLTNSQSLRDIADFCHSLSKMAHSNHLVKEITFLLSNLPYEELKWLLTLEKYFPRSDSLVPNGSSSLVLGAFMKQRIFILTESEKQYLFDKHGNIRKSSSLTGRSRVTYFPEKNPEFYLKQYPEWPGYEFASTLFMRLLGIQHLPHHDLIILNSKYPVLLTQKVHGDPVLRIWHKPRMFRNLDPVHTGLLIISAMLINPEDGKEDNFILSLDKKYLIPIDNDHCFLPSTFQKKGSFWNAFTVNTALQTKTILFCLDEMSMPIPLQVKQQLLSLDFDFVFKKWMIELDKIENKLNNLVPQDEQNKFLAQGTVMRIPFYKQFIHNIYWKAHKIQNILKTASQSTPFDLLKAVEPFAARCYQDSFKQGDTLQSRFKAVTDSLYKKTATDGRRVSILNTRAMMEIINISEKDLQNDIMFQRMGPIDALELLNQLIQERTQKATLEQEMLCELDEKKQETSWTNLFGNSPGEAALKDFFSNPKEGLVLKGSKLITSSKLSELFAQTPEKGMRIRFLSLPQSPSLTDKEIRILVEGCPNIEYLNVSGCVKLKQILTADGEWALLVRLEAKDCVNLEKIVSYSPIKILQIETDQKIEIFIAKSTVDTFTISKKKIDFWLSLKKRESFQIKSQGDFFSSDSFMDSLGLWGLQGWNEMKNNFQDIKITIGGSSISSEDLETLVPEIELDHEIENIQNLQNLVVLNLIHLKRLNLSNNTINDEGLGILTKGNWVFLETLNLASNKITAKGIVVLAKRSNWPQLKHLDLSENKINDEGLKALTQGNWLLLETLDLFNTYVTKKSLINFLFYANWPQFKEITLPKFWDSSNQMLAQSFIKKELSQLEQLDLNNHGITFDQLHSIFKKYQCPRLKSLNISNNEISLEGISVLTLADCSLLEELHIENIKITSKEVKSIANETKWQQLKRLNVSQNEIRDEGLSALLLAEWSFFESLNLSNTKISLKGVETIVRQPKCLRLKHLNMSNNEISDEGVSILALAEWSLLENLNLSNTKLSLKGMDNILEQSKWPQRLKYLDISNNEIFDEGLSVLALNEWSLLDELNVKNTKITQQGIEIIVNRMKLSSLKKLDISENNIFDEGLRKLVLGNWPLLQHLVYYKTKVTEKGHTILLESFKWPHLNHLEHSLDGSFYNYNENPSEMILAMIPISYEHENQKEQPFLVIVLNTTWSNSKEIFLSISDNDINEKVIIVPRNKLDKFKSIKFSFDVSPKLTPLQLIVWPPNIRKFQISPEDELFCDQSQIETLFSQNCPPIEDLCLSKTGIQRKCLEILINRLNPSTFKKIDISHNSINPFPEVRPRYGMGCLPTHPKYGSVSWIIKFDDYLDLCDEEIKKKF